MLGRMKSGARFCRLANETSNPVKAPPSNLHATDQKPPSPSTDRQKDDLSHRYTIIKQDEPKTDRPRLPTSPPKVISHKDLPQKKTDFKMYDAVLSGDGDSSVPTFDSEMEKFMPMLTNYLKIHDMSPPGSPSAENPAAESSVPIPESKSRGDDYVWDVFYHRPTELSEWNAIANIGTLTGLPPSITDPNDSDSDTEPEDEADEDSNEEEYYKNDYPEEDSSSNASDGSDMFHEQSDYEDMLDDSFDEHRWR